MHFHPVLLIVCLASACAALALSVLASRKKRRCPRCERLKSEHSFRRGYQICRCCVEIDRHPVALPAGN